MNAAVQQDTQTWGTPVGPKPDRRRQSSELWRGGITSSASLAETAAPAQGRTRAVWHEARTLGLQSHSGPINLGTRGADAKTPGIYTPRFLRTRHNAERRSAFRGYPDAPALSETCYGRWLVACYLAQPIVCRRCSLCPKSRERTKRLARPRSFASHSSFAFAPRHYKAKASYESGAKDSGLAGGRVGALPNKRPPKAVRFGRKSSCLGRIIALAIPVRRAVCTDDNGR